MQRSNRTVTVYSVLYYDDKHIGAAGDGTHVMRFRSIARASEFAKGKTVYGKPATVDTDDVPAHIAARWPIN